MNIKKILSNIGKNILLGILILGVLFVFVGIMSTKINWLFIAIGIALLFPFGIFFLLDLNKDSKLITQKESEFQDFIKTADRVFVLLNDATIHEKKHTEIREVEHYKASALNEITGNGHHNEERVTHTYCEVTLRANYKDRYITYVETVNKDATSVRMKFFMQKSTILYVNPKNTTEYFMDLNFLND